MGLEGYVGRFARRVEALRADPRVEVLLFRPGPGLGVRALRDWERAHDATLDPALRALYAQADGLALRWILTDSEPQREWRERAPPEATGWDHAVGDYPQNQGLVLLRPLDRLIAPGFWVGAEDENENENEDDAPFSLDGELFTEGALRRRLLPWDLWSYSQFATLLTRATAGAPWLVLHGGDHGATFFDQRVLDIESYLEMLLASLGHLDTRCATLDGYRGPLPEGEVFRGGRAYWASHPVPIEALLR